MNHLVNLRSSYHRHPSVTLGADSSGEKKCVKKVPWWALVLAGGGGYGVVYLMTRK